MKKAKLMLGDNIESLKKLPDNSIDSVVTDPPYALTSIRKRFGKEGSAPAQYGTDGAFQRASKGFMGKEWDAEVPSVEFWQQVYRVLKPGGHILSFGGTRTYHRMVVNIEDAGFEIRDQIQWLYGSGFPKSHNIGKSVDKLEGNDREWEGWGSALKPANEPICLARKPLSEKSIAENVLKWKTGGINVDGCRIEVDINNEGSNGKRMNKSYKGSSAIFGNCDDNTTFSGYDTGRFPANLILDESAAEMLDEQSGISKRGLDKVGKEYNSINDGSKVGMKNIMVSNYPGVGGASRFFYVAKVSKAERNMGLDEFEDKGKGWSNYLPSTTNGTSDVIYDRTTTTKNTHPTVKPVNLMSYLCKLITPPNGIVLDPFMGSGSTGISALLNDFRFVGMEMDNDYFKIAEARIDNFEDYRKFLKK